MGPRTVSMSDVNNICHVVFLGMMEYAQALELQRRICEAKKHGNREDVLLLLEHPPTVTIGRNGDLGNLLVSREILENKGVQLFEIERGGDITFHGPGQLVGYPILELRKNERDLRRYLRNLEEALIRVLAIYGVGGARDDDWTGVWTDRGKIAAIGVHISRWVTRHGFALNVNTDLSFFDLIVPCGIEGRGVVSIGSLLGRRVELKDLASDLASEFGSVFGRDMVWTSESGLYDRMLPRETSETS